MALGVKAPKTDRLAREMAQITGETLTVAVRTALEERRQRERRRQGSVELAEQLAALRQEWAALPDDDARTADEIVGYDETGMW